MWTRRNWLMAAGGGLAGSLVGCGFSGEEKVESGRDRGAMRRAAAADFPKGWGLWEHGRNEEGWQVGETGPILSITKCLAGLAVVRGVDQGMFGMEERVSGTLTEWRGDGVKGRITVRMLLQQTSGLEAGSSALYRSGLADKSRVALGLRVQDAPGSVFRYGPSHWEVLAEFLRRKWGGKALEPFLEREVLGALGLRSRKWRADRAGRFYLSTGAELSVSDLARLGETVGRLEAGQGAAGFSASGFREVTKVSAANRMYGGGLWRNHQAARVSARRVEVEDVLDAPRGAGFWNDACLSRKLPTGLVGLIGSAGQRVWIWPGGTKVFARLGRSPRWKDGALLEALA